MFELSDVMTRVDNALDLCSADQNPEAPATPGQIQHAVDYARSRFDLALPTTQIAFWQRCNGMSFNGFNWYRAKGIDSPELFISSFVDANEIYGETTGRDFVYYGDGELDAYLYDVGRNSFVVADRTSLSETAALPSFEALFSYVLDYHIAQWEHRPVPEASAYRG